MARARSSGDDPVATPDVGGVVARAGADWLAPLCGRLLAMHRRQRLPHALLLLGQPQGGQTEVGLWLAALLLCEQKGSASCGACPGCRLFLAATHPDFCRVGLEEDSAVIRVEQIRGLSERFSFKSYRGGAKVALIDPADAMNLSSFNALLKVLEEPSENTHLILCASRSDRLPRTIVSRCARLRVPLPSASEALEWLNRHRIHAGWERLLNIAGGAPFLALEYAASGVEVIDVQMQEAVGTAEQGELDIHATAESWSRDQPGARLVWLESWLTARLRAAASTSDLVNNNRMPGLRDPAREPMIRGGYRLLDALREARSLVDGALNTQLLFEGLLISITALLGADATRSRESAD